MKPKKKFNIKGRCYPEDHYMMDTSSKLDYIMGFIHEGEYFTINRPRQYGKTTILTLIEKLLRKEEAYICIRLSFEITTGYETAAAFALMFWERLGRYTQFQRPELFDFVQSLQADISDMYQLSIAITKLVHKTKKKIVLLIDEVDASGNHLAFLAFLAVLRSKYLNRKEPEDHTFHAVILAGVHDVSSLKYKIRNPEEARYNSPWNIAARFDKDMAFSATEIASMLVEYRDAESVSMDIESIAERLYYYTSGHPFLVSKLCRNIVDELLAKQHTKTWASEDIEQAVQLTLKETNANFESLFKNLETHKELYNLVYAVLIEGAVIPFSPNEPATNLGRIYGVFKENGRLKIHNRIYEQLIYNYMSTKTLRNYLNQKDATLGDTLYIRPDNSLNLEHALSKFQSFMKVQRSEKDASFIERQWRLVFLAFLQPIINGKGHDFKEVEISEEKRLDIVVTYHQHKYIIELKLWRGDKSHAKGLEQLANYLDIHSVQTGYLVIFDNRKEKTWERQWISHKGKDIFAVWV